MNTIVSHTLSVHQEHEFLGRLESAGLTDELAQRVIESKGNELAKRVVAYIQRGGYEATTTQKLAREIMGDNFLGIEEAIQHFGVNFSDRELQALSEVPFSEGVLRLCQKTHILVCVPSISILGIRCQVERGLFYSYEDSWYNNQKFAKVNGQVSWQLVKKTAINGSQSKNWQEQQKLLPEVDFVPDARIMTYTIIGHYLATGKRIFEKDYVRTSDVDSDGDRVNVGYFDSRGLGVGSVWDDRRDGDLGLASARKS